MCFVPSVLSDNSEKSILRRGDKEGKYFKNQELVEVSTSIDKVNELRLSNEEKGKVSLNIIVKLE
jgi:hypothetical protein